MNDAQTEDSHPGDKEAPPSRAPMPVKTWLQGPIHEITTREELARFIAGREGYLYNDFGGRNPKMCPIHHATCPSLSRMLRVGEGALSVQKLSSERLAELVVEVERRGKVYAFCGIEPGLATGQAPGSSVSPSPGGPTREAVGASRCRDPADARATA